MKHLFCFVTNQCSNCYIFGNKSVLSLSYCKRWSNAASLPITMVRTGEQLWYSPLTVLSIYTIATFSRSLHRKRTSQIQKSDIFFGLFILYWSIKSLALHKCVTTYRFYQIMLKPQWDPVWMLSVWVSNTGSNNKFY